MGRYERDIRRRTRRHDDSGLVGCFTMLVCVLILAFLAGIVIHLWRDVNRRATTQPTMDSMSYTRTSDGSMIKVYVVTDPDTGVQYVVSDRGGICVREKRNGQ